MNGLKIPPLLFSYFYFEREEGILFYKGEKLKGCRKNEQENEWKEKTGGYKKR